MAKPKSNPTQAQKDYDAFKLAHGKAVEAFEKAKDEKAKQAAGVAVKEARAKMDAAAAAVNRERFVKYAGIRTNAALEYIEGIGAVFKGRGYEFTRADADRILNALRAEITNLETVINAALSAPKSAEKKKEAKEAKFAF